VLPFRLVYHDGYDLDLGAHVFPARKYRLIRDRLMAEGFAEASDFVAPAPIAEEDLLLVHEAGWVARLRNGTLGYLEILKLEVPYSRRLVEGFFLAAGGTLLAARRALEDRVGFNVGGGFHHAFPGHGEGFCAIHDVAVAVRVLQREGSIGRALVVDLDVHQGNGTAAIFAGDESVYTLSVHQRNNYPEVKPPSSLDVELEDGTGDEEYLRVLERALERAIGESRPDLVMYVAGADPYREDQLGGLALTLDGLEARDRMVFEMGLRAAPVVVTLAGGYASNTNDTVTIHCNTARAARRVLSGR
jgi:acetoin utilization deacetylase AcuC-like enzyme